MHITMKKRFLSLLALTLFLPAFAACAPYDYSDRLSEVRSDLFVAETEDFTLQLSCLEREYPYADDGVPCPMSKTLQVELVPVVKPDGDVEIYIGDGGTGGEASYRTAYGDYTFSVGTDVFPQESVSLRVEYGGKTHTIAATSVRTAETLTPAKALAKGVEAERETLDNMRKEGVFCGELCVRLLKRDKNYYYFAVTDGTRRVALLMDGETGEVLARREDSLRS